MGNKYEIETRSKVMNHIMGHMPDKWEGLSDDEKLRILYPSDFSLEAEAKGKETAPIYFDNEDAVDLMVFVNSVYNAVPKSTQMNTEFSAKSLPPLFWGKLGIHTTVWMSQFASVTQKREAHIELLNLLVPNLDAFVMVGSLYVK
ncbi:MAG: hypothetical protein P8I31_02810 [Bacteroidia bacterium]|nr:hypothetical protein [Bacteroidia bacterium]